MPPSKKTPAAKGGKGKAKQPSALRATYKAAGVDIDAGDRFVEAIKPLAKATTRKEVVSGIGGFGALFKLDLKKFRKPVLVSSTDGVGTKLKIAMLAGKHDTIGIDLVAMSVNDLIVQGAEPLFFLDYLSCGKLSSIDPVAIVKGIADGCKESGCALVGGETAEMPGMYPDGEYDLAGFAVGAVDEDKMITGSKVKRGHLLIGLASSGLHSNGYSLARKLFLHDHKFALNKKVDELGKTLAEELLTPTRIYARTVAALLKDLPIHAMAHITGGGVENIPRVLPKGTRAVIQHGSWPWLPVFEVMQKLGRIDQAEMYRTFNCGIGLVLAVPAEEEDQVMKRLRKLGEKAYVIGYVDAAKGQNAPRVVVV